MREINYQDVDEYEGAWDGEAEEHDRGRHGVVADAAELELVQQHGEAGKFKDKLYFPKNKCFFFFFFKYQVSNVAITVWNSIM